MPTIYRTDVETAYVLAVRAALDACKGALAAWLTPVCPECRERPTPELVPGWNRGWAVTGGHILLDGYVVVGCEGYHVVDPNAVGVPAPDWSDWTK